MKIIVVTSILASLLAMLPVQAATLPGIPRFIDEMVDKYQFKRAELEKVFDRAKELPTVIEAISRPATAKPWLEYRAAFVNSGRIKSGLKFWSKYAKSLRRAEKEFGVPQEIIVAVIGVETVYGKDAGSFRTLDSLTTLAFAYPRREEFFRSELEHYLLLAREQQFNLLAIRGSYAGAMGIPQFMPSSYRNYAVDFNGNRKVDLLGEASDAIGSVGNYLKHYGWSNKAPIAVRALLVKNIGTSDIGAPRSLAAWSEAGVEPVENLPPDLSARLVDFTLPDGKEWWLVFDDFEVITRYNNSDYYAMTVWQLAEELKQARRLSVGK